jgi:hypothetical protein
MAEPTSRAIAAVKDYAGLKTNLGPTASSAGAGEADDLVNLMVIRQGELTCRPGYKVVEFDDE